MVFPGLLEEVEAHLLPAPDDDRVMEVEYCNNSSAIYHLEPIDDVVVREWSADGELVEATLLLGRFAMGAFSQKAADIPLLAEKQDWLLEHSGAMKKSYAYREIRALFNHFPKRELFYADLVSLKEIFDRVVYMTSDDDIAVHARKGPGYVALYVAFAQSRYSYKAQEDLRRAHIEPYAWIINKSLLAARTRDALLQQRLLGERRQIDRVRRFMAKRVFFLPWQANPPIGSAALQELGHHQSKEPSLT